MESARVRAIYDHARTRRTLPEPVIGGIRRVLSRCDFSRSIRRKGGGGRNLRAKVAPVPSRRFLDKDAKKRFQHGGDRAISVHDGRGTKPLPEKEISLEH